MNHLELDNNNSLYVDYQPAKGRPTFVFINALTGNTDHWENSVAPDCRKAGFGTLSYNMRGQINTKLSEDNEPNCDLIVSDLVHLLNEIKPEQPILCGLSIGGLYAAKAALAGADVKALVLLNTLREIGPRLAWLNQGMVHVLNTGGFPLLLDMYLPLLTSQDFHQGMRSNHLKGEGYEPEPSDTGAYRLMQAAVKTDWDIDYEKLDVPVLSISGLQDRVFFEKDTVERLGARIGNWQHLQWPDAGHLLPLEVPEKLSGALIAFGEQLA